MDQELAKVSVFVVSETNQMGNELVMYPNPARDYINVDLSIQNQELVKMSIYNQLGELVQEESPVSMFPGKNHARIPLSASLKSGVYLLRVAVGETSVVTQRFVKAGR